MLRDNKPLKRTQNALPDNNLASNIQKLIITDAFRTHFLKHNKEWLIKNFRLICTKKQFIE